MRAYIQENHSEYNEQHINQLTCQVLLFEQYRTTEETYYNTTATHHWHNWNHCTRQTQRIEIYEVGNTQENTNKHNTPTPMKRRCLLTCRIPNSEYCTTHEAKLINIIPTLHYHSAQSHSPILRRSHKILVVQPADSAKHSGHNKKEYPTSPTFANQLMEEVTLSNTSPCST